MATVAETIAIWSGVAAVSYCPMADSATCEASIRVSKLLGATGDGIRSPGSLKPNRRAIPAMSRSPIPAPSRAKTVLQEARKASFSGASSQPSAALPSRVAVPGSG